MARQFWYIKYDNYKKQDSATITVSIYQRKRPKIQHGDKVLLYSNGLFHKVGLVLGLTEKLIEDFMSKDRSEYKYTILNLEEIEEPSDLLSFAYSLPRIYKYFTKPERHFKRNYGKISEYEFQVIEDHNYYISRTAFGKLFNSLHPIHQKEFIKYSYKEFPTIMLQRDINYLQLFRYLSDYVNNHILTHAKILVESDKILKSDLNVDSKVGFIDPEDELNKLFVIEYQSKKIKDAEKLLTEGINLAAIVNQVESYSKEDQFHRKYFKNIPLPINYIFYDDQD